MKNSNGFKIAFMIFVLLGFTLINKYHINQINEKFEQYHIIDAECEEVIVYKQFARPQLLCYMGDDHNYNSNERRVIKQWKNGRYQ